MKRLVFAVMLLCCTALPSGAQIRLISQAQQPSSRPMVGVVSADTPFEITLPTQFQAQGSIAVLNVTAGQAYLVRGFILMDYSGEATNDIALSVDAASTASFSYLSLRAFAAWANPGQVEGLRATAKGESLWTSTGNAFSGAGPASILIEGYVSVSTSGTLALHVNNAKLFDEIVLPSTLTVLKGSYVSATAIQ